MSNTREGSLAWRPLMAVCAVLGCGPEVNATADLDRVCGAPSPFRLLELDPSRTISTVYQAAVVDERRVLSVGYVHDEESLEDFPWTSETELWSVGTCGETPVRLEADTRWVPAFDAWPDQLLGCRADDEIVALDPLGERPSHVVFRVEGCSGTRTPAGLVAIEPHDDETGALVLLPYPDDPWTQTAEPQVLLDPIRTHAEPPHAIPAELQVLAVFDDEAFAIVEGGALVHLSLADGSTTTEAENVDSFEVSDDRRWLIWQDATRTAGESEDWPEGAVFLRDRSTGETTHLADTALAYTIGSPFDFADESYVRLQIGGYSTGPQRFFSLTGSETFDIPPGHWLLGQKDGSWIDGGELGFGPFGIFDFATRSFTTLFPGEGSLVWRDDDRLLIRQGAMDGLFGGDGRTEAELWAVELDGTTELLAHRVGDSVVLTPGGRVATVLDLDATWRGDLVTIAPGSLEEQRIDTAATRGVQAVDDEKTLLYVVSDADRTGVWLARIADD